MELVHVLAFNAALIVAIFSPGPALLYFVQSTLAYGRPAGIVTCLGLATMASIWTLLALLGLDGLFRLVPWAYAGLKTAGALYLIFIAWQAWKNAHRPVEAAERPHARAYLGGFLVNLANPKSVLFSAAVLVVIFPPDIAMAAKAFVAFNQFAVEALFYSAFAVLLSSRSVSRRYLRAKPILDRIAATVLGGLGIRLLVER